MGGPRNTGHDVRQPTVSLLCKLGEHRPACRGGHLPTRAHRRPGSREGDARRPGDRGLDGGDGRGRADPGEALGHRLQERDPGVPIPASQRMRRRLMGLPVAVPLPDRRGPPDLVKDPLVCPHNVQVGVAGCPEVRAATPRVRLQAGGATRVPPPAEPHRDELRPAMPEPTIERACTRRPAELRRATRELLEKFLVSDPLGLAVRLALSDGD